MSHVNTYGGSPFGQTIPEADCAEVHIDGPNIVGQMSQLPGNGHGFLIRVWPPNGTHEYGGSNGTAISCVIRFDGDEPILESMNFYRPPAASRLDTTQEGDGS